MHTNESLSLLIYGCEFDLSTGGYENEPANLKNKSVNEQLFQSTTQKYSIEHY